MTIVTFRGSTLSERWQLRVARVPASLFAMPLGLFGLGGAWRAATALWGVPATVSEATMCAAVIVWSAISVLYASKWIWAREAALTEWRHPVRRSFITLAPVSLMLVALAVNPFHEGLARFPFVVGAAGQLAFAVWSTAALWNGARDPLATTPVLYLPTVAGSFVLATVAATLGHVLVGTLAFGAGMFSWVSLESVVVHRLLVHETLAAPLLPTLGIQLAPPTVGCVAYLGITMGTPDVFALSLLGYGLLQACILLRLTPRFRATPFTAAFWAFTFGVTALAQGAIRIVIRGRGELEWLALALFVIANAVVAMIALRTATLVAQRRLLPEPS